MVAEQQQGGRPAGAVEVGADQRAALQVEGHQRGRGEQAVQGGGGGLLDGERQFHGRVDHLPGAVLTQLEGGAQRFVPADHAGQGPAEQLRVDGPVEAEHPGHDVGRRARVPLVQEPQSALEVRERRLGGTGPGEGRALAVVRGRGDRGGELGQGRRVEDRVRGDHAEHVEDAADHAYGGERIPAQVEEVVVGADLGHPEDIGPDGGDQLLRGRARGAADRGRRGGLGLGLGQRGPVHLASGGQREGVQRGDGRGDHVLGEPLGQVGAQRGRVGSGGGTGAGHVRGEAAFVGHHDRCGDAGVSGQDLLDLAGLHAEAADLHLVVRTADELQRAEGCGLADHVTGAVHPGARLRREGVRDEPARGQARASVVAGGQHRTAEVQLTGGTGHHRPPPVVPVSYTHPARGRWR